MDWKLIPHYNVVINKDCSDVFSVNYHEDFDGSGFVKDHSHLSFLELKQFVETKYHKEKNYQYFDKYVKEK